MYVCISSFKAIQHSVVVAGWLLLPLDPIIIIISIACVRVFRHRSTRNDEFE